VHLPESSFASVQRRSLGSFGFEGSVLACLRHKLARPSPTSRPGSDAGAAVTDTAERAGVAGGDNLGLSLGNAVASGDPRHFS
jgi:hypothetical protein